MFDTLLICILGIIIFVVSIIFDRYVKYVDHRSPRMIEKEKIIKEKLQNKEQLTKSELFHFYSYALWNVIIKIGIYGGIVMFLIGSLIALIK